MTRNIYRITVGFILLFPASAMHGTAREYATEPTNPARLATARSVNFVASLMDMGAGALVLIGVAPYFSSMLGGLRPDLAEDRERPAQAQLTDQRSERTEPEGEPS